MVFDPNFGGLINQLTAMKSDGTLRVRQLSMEHSEGSSSTGATARATNHHSVILFAYAVGSNIDHSHLELIIVDSF